MALYDVPAPAKINLFLHVTGRRADGYHFLQTAFRFVDLNDYLSFVPRDDGQVRREHSTLAGLDPEQDLVVRAARALQQATGTRKGVDISCIKHIPSGAGMGGGSSDAATTLIALNRLWSLGLSRQALMDIALSLGADVPVFVFGQAAFAQGVGEQLQAIQLPERDYVIIRPPQFISTAEIFTSKGLTRDEKPITITFFADWQERFWQAGENIPLFGKNNLESVALDLYPNLRKLKNSLHSSGFNARMTGSGSCFFVECRGSKDKRDALVRQAEIGRIGSKIHHAGSAANSDASLMEQTWVCSGLQDHPLRYWID
ncbi:MAG: 4-(cytidine 5'-diphospho)-2-C-methyl-D-erythritol kinase [Alcaligenes sp.]